MLSDAEDAELLCFLSPGTRPDVKGQATDAILGLSGHRWDTMNTIISSAVAPVVACPAQTLCLFLEMAAASSALSLTYLLPCLL